MLRAGVDWDTKVIEVDDHDTWLTLRRKYDIPDGFGINTVEWELYDRKRDIHIVKLDTLTYICREVGVGKSKREYSCGEHYTKKEYLDHVSAPITAKYHLLNYLSRTNSPKATSP